MIVSYKKKEFEALENLLVFLDFIFYIYWRQFIYLFHILFASVNVLGIDCQKILLSLVK
jgi:hypothetical protein